ncbi:MAG TPA: FAD-binding protein [Myxococcota bacterium]|nr:FAD-binding protein [Myxococcota bacterium]HRY95435.1 FAD-binding protein [Myxococcota bacterium]HSA22418.1 FAD-binding protein [Myxococcota bacterium]
MGAREYDLVIVGAGPAGATLARLVGPGLRVLLVDRRSLDRPCQPGDPEKCCGGLLAPDAQEMLARLRLGVPHACLADPQLFSVRVLDLDNGLERHYQRFYLNVDRERFDRWLYGLVPEAVERRPGTRLVGLTPGQRGCRLSLERDGRREEVAARWVVGADGAHSAVRGLAFPAAPWPRRYTALQHTFEFQEDHPHYLSVFDRRVTDYYSWAIPKQGTLLVGSALAPDGGARARFDLLLAALRQRGFRLGRRLKRRGCWLLRPFHPGHILPGGGRVLLLGEAAGLISPSSAEGISFALRSALCLARSLAEAPDEPLRRYARALLPMRVALVAKACKAPFIHHPALRGPILRSGLASVKVEGAE